MNSAETSVDEVDPLNERLHLDDHYQHLNPICRMHDERQLGSIVRVGYEWAD
jgi:hypothetical protein